MSRIVVLVWTLLLAARGPASGDGGRQDPAPLTVDRIYASGEFSADGFSSRWLPDGSAYVTLESAAGPPGGKDLVRHDPRNGRREVLVPSSDLVPPGSASPLEIEDYAWSRDLSQILLFTNSRRVWRRNTRGDYWLLDRSRRALQKIGGDAEPSTLMFAKLSPTGRHVAYVRDRSLYVQDLTDRRLRCLARAEDERLINGTFDWVYEEELDLRDGFLWSPDGESIAYWQVDTRGVPDFPLVNATDSLYPRVTWFPYPKVGQRNPSVRAGVVSLRTGETRWIDVPGDPREHYIARMEWAGNPEELLLQQLNRPQTANRVLLADARTGSVKEVLTETDEAWVDVHDELFWLPGGGKFTWISERDGWRHVYVASRADGKLKLATPGPFDVIRLLKVDEAGEWLYFLASPENPTQRFLYRARTDGTGMERLTPAGARGSHDYALSPDARWAVHTASSFDTPPVVDLVELPGHAPARVLVTNETLRAKLETLRRRPTEFFRVDIGGGVQLDGWCIAPPEPAPDRKYPLLVYVYGEPAGQTVVDRWGGRDALWHSMLAQRGYVVMSFDNRGTPAPRGRAWRKIATRQVGILAPQDQAAAVKEVLARRPALDPARVGVWGWSGGGSMSLNAIFKYPDLYHTAIAIASVPDQRYYDTIYQERYMGLLDQNAEGFKQGSPITFAHQLKGHLLLIHGTGDDNCHYQTAELLINELIHHNKQFTMFAYPNRSHSIHEGKNTTRHLREMMTRFLLEKMPP